MSKYQIMPLLTEEEYQSLKNDIAERGILVPIELDEDGNILDGHHRLRAWQELNANGNQLPDYTRVVRGGLTEEQKRNHIRALNIIRRQLSDEQRAQLWADMRKDGAGYEEIGKATGVGEATVRRAVSSNDETQPDHVIGKDGKKYPPRKKRKKQEKPKPPEAPMVSIFTDSDKGEEKAKAQTQKAVESGSNGASQQVQVTIFSNESVEWYTPPEVVELARQVMGGIDLDPASSDEAQANIKAKSYFTEKDDGLSLPWLDRVWLNPPYSKTGGRSNQEIWAEKLIKEYQSGHTTEAILLVKAAVGYKWFEELWDSWPVCFIRQRLSFIKNTGDDEGESKQGTALFYFGTNLEKFIGTFGTIGRITTPDGRYISGGTKQ